MNCSFSRLGLAVAMAISLSLTACGGGGASDSTTTTGSGASDTSGSTGSTGDSSSSSSPQPYVGFFYNNTLRTGGWVEATLAADAARITGPWNFTQDEAESTVLCGAGTDVVLTRSGTNHSGTFSSVDTDAGCGFDAGYVFSLNGSHDSSVSHLSGIYSVANTSTQGVYEVWLNGPDELVTCTGTSYLPADSSTPAATVNAVAAFYVGTQVLWGQAGIQNRNQTTGSPISCLTESQLIGKRDAATGTVEMKMILTGKTGAECTGTASGSLHLGGTYSSASGLSATQSSSTQPLTMTLSSCSVSKVSPSGTGDAAAMQQALQATVRRHAF